MTLCLSLLCMVVTPVHTGVSLFLEIKVPVGIYPCEVREFQGHNT
jgi:hypothetical protein